MSSAREKLQRINVVGTSGSGKSSFSKRLAAALGQKRVELDLLYWDKNWTGVADETLLARLEAALASET